MTEGWKIGVLDTDLTLKVDILDTNLAEKEYKIFD